MVHHIQQRSETPIVIVATLVCRTHEETILPNGTKEQMRAFRNTRLSEQGWQLTDVTQCIYANMYRHARTLLEQRGLLASPAKHQNGADWIFWAEERE